MWSHGMKCFYLLCYVLLHVSCSTLYVGVFYLFSITDILLLLLASLQANYTENRKCYIKLKSMLPSFTNSPCRYTEVSVCCRRVISFCRRRILKKKQQLLLWYTICSVFIYMLSSSLWTVTKCCVRLFCVYLYWNPFPLLLMPEIWGSQFS